MAPLRVLHTYAAVPHGEELTGVLKYVDAWWLWMVDDVCGLVALCDVILIDAAISGEATYALKPSCSHACCVPI